MRHLITELFVSRFDNPALSELADAALLEVNGSRLAFSTDSYVIKPVEFPGGGHRQARGVRHGERYRRNGSAASLPFDRFYP